MQSNRGQYHQDTGIRQTSVHNIDHATEEIYTVISKVGNWKVSGKMRYAELYEKASAWYLTDSFSRINKEMAMSPS